MNYVIGTFWLLCLLLFFYLAGCAFSRQDRCGPFKILIGYLIYSFGVAIPGIVIQILNLEYTLFRNLMWFWISGLLIVSVLILYKKGGLKLPDTHTVRKFCTNYWALILIISGVLFLSALNYPAYWLGNRSDDGYYLSQIASYPVVEKPFEYNLATGLYTGHVINSYSLNTHELEASVFFQTLGIPIGLFARIFLAAEGLTIFACCIYALSYEIIVTKSRNYKYESVIQFIPGLLFLFTANFVYLSNMGILDIQDSWQTSTAMYFGSSVVRTSGFFLLLVPFIDRFNLNLNVIFKVIAISLVLISKSTIAVPLIFVTAVSYILVYLLYYKNCNKYLLILLVICLILAGALLPYVVDLNQFGFDDIRSIESSSASFLRNNIKSIIPWITLIGVFSGMKSKRYHILVLDGLLALFLFLPGLKTYGCILSFFAFVMGRVISSFTYFHVCLMLSFVVNIICRSHINKKNIALSGFCFTALLAVINMQSFLKYGGNAEISQGSGLVPTTLQNALTVLSKNPYFMPTSTVDLGDALNRLQSKRGKIAVLTETYYQSDGVADLKYILTRSTAPSVVFPAANIRFPSDIDPIYGTYTAEQQKIFESFLVNNDQASTSAFGELLNTYCIDAVILQDGSIYNANMNQLGFSLYETITDDNGNPAYYLYAR